MNLDDVVLARPACILGLLDKTLNPYIYFHATNKEDPSVRRFFIITLLSFFISSSIFASALDVDGNGSDDALTDGLLVIRHFFRFSGDTLIADAVGTGATRDTAETIIDYINTLGMQLDIDGNGQLDALTDGLLIIRYLFGFSNQALIDSAVGDQCSRCDHTAIENYLAGLTADTVTNPLNDTGITWGGDYPSGNNSTCTSNISAPQDCHQGRDTTHNDDSDGHAGFSFTKLDANGNPLPASATSWSCVKDNVTGLIWEVKTTDGGIHDKNITYRWGGKTHLGSGFGTYYNDWDLLVDSSNAEQLCGYSDWRVPTTEELESIVNYGRTNPAIDTNYFPNTPGSYFWSALPNVDSFDAYAWYVNFSDGDVYYAGRGVNRHVRLVSGQ